MGDRKSAQARGRQDKRDTVSRASRRLDSLSLLLESNVTCAAIAIFGGQLHISANDIYEDQPKAKTQEFIHKVLSFLKEVANSGEANSAAEILEAIISKRADITAAAAKIIVPYVLIGDGSASIAQILKEHPEAQLPVEKVGQAVGWASVLINDLKKQVDFLKNHPEEAVMLAQALQKFPIVVDAGEANVHAEMRLLGEIIQQIEAKKTMGPGLYIGISKLCCLKCVCMLEATKEELSKLGITLQFGGEHDLEKNWEWHSPTMFPKDIFDKPDLSSCSQLIKAIVQKARDIYAEKIKTKETKGVKQERDLSESSGDELDPALTHLQYLTETIRALKMEQKAVGDSEELQQKLTMLQLGIELHKAEAFKGLFYKRMPGMQEDCMLAFSAILTEKFGKKVSSEEKLKFIEFLKNSRFSGKIISVYFQNFTLPFEDVWLEENAAKLVELSRNDGQALRELVNSACTTENASRKSLLACTLDFMGKTNVEQLTLILNTLSLKELSALDIMLKDSVYVGFVELKREVILTARATELIELSKNNEQEFRDLISGVCVEGRVESKTLLAHVLDFVGKTNFEQLTLILHTLSLKELGILNAMLNDKTYDAFIPLRREVELAWNSAKLLEYSKDGGQKLLDFVRRTRGTPTKDLLLYTLRRMHYPSLMQVLDIVASDKCLATWLSQEINSAFNAKEDQDFRARVTNRLLPQQFAGLLRQQQKQEQSSLKQAVKKRPDTDSARAQDPTNVKRQKPPEHK